MCEVRVDATEAEMHDMVAALKARFGERVRTITKLEWLVEAERKPVEPFQLTKIVDYLGPRGNRVKRRNRHSE